jgi:hypothetical protein
MHRISSAVLLGIFMSLCSHARETGEGEFTLTSVRHNIHVDEWRTSGSAKTESGRVKWSVNKTTLHGGKQEGVDLITIDNGQMQIRVIPTRGLSILDARVGDMRLGWDSPVTQVVHPQYVNLESRGGLGWLEGFNEWMTRCGLEFAGHPGKDEFISNTGDKATMDLTLHGKVGNIPASEVQVIIDEKPPHRIRVRGTVYEQGFYGPKLELTAEISTEPGSDTFRIEDGIRNNGAFEQEFQLIYHANFGAPLLQKDSQVLTAAKKISPMNSHAGKDISSFSTYAEPTKGFIEQVYLIEPYADTSGRSIAMLRNAAADRAASISFSIEQLTYLTIWKNTAAIEDGYVTGLEPATGFPYNRRIERQFGRVPKLAPGQSRSFVLDIGIHVGKESVSAKAAEIEKLRAGRSTQVEKEPPTPPVSK